MKPQYLQKGLSRVKRVKIRQQFRSGLGLLCMFELPSLIGVFYIEVLLERTWFALFAWFDVVQNLLVDQLFLLVFLLFFFLVPFCQQVRLEGIVVKLADRALLHWPIQVGG